MKHLARLQGVAVTRRVQQIAMPLTKGVMHLGHDGGQLAVCLVAIPKAHRLEGVAPDARKGLQPNFAVGVLHAFLLQHLGDPSQSAALCGTAAIAVVGIVKRQRRTAVQRQVSVSAFGLQAPHRQHQKVTGVSKHMADRTQPGMAHLPQAQECAARGHVALW